jgi:hypothetical protein
MSDLIYNIPVTAMESYPGRPIVLRVDRLDAIPLSVVRNHLKQIQFVQLSSLDGQQAGRLFRKLNLPLNFVMARPQAQLPDLYKLAHLAAGLNVRVSIPSKPGFGKAVKLSASLNFAVKLEFDPYEKPPVAELSAIVDMYLHQTTVSQPIEFLHSVLMEFLHGEPMNLWDIQEENPARFCHVTDDGRKTLPGRLRNMPIDRPAGEFLSYLGDQITQTGSPCRGCDFIDPCLGYFKWPFRNFDCTLFKTVFKTLNQAAAELRSDQAAFAQTLENIRREH